MHSLSTKLGCRLPIVVLSTLKFRNYQQSPNEILKNRGERKRKTNTRNTRNTKKRNTKTKQKTETILKFKCLESISYIVDLTVLFIFSGLKNKKKSRHQ